MEILLKVIDFIIVFLQTYLGFWAVLTFLEAAFPACKSQKLFSKHSLNDLIHAIIIAAIFWPWYDFFKVLFTENLFALYLPHHIFDQYIQRLPYLLQVTVALFILDIGQYVRHRIMHSKPMWNFHAAHHSAIEIRSSAQFRFHPVDYFLAIFFNILSLYILGFEGSAIQGAMLFIVFTGLLNHSNINVDFGPLRKIIVSPNYHKWHHATDHEAHNKNFADFFPIIDIIGGTYYFPKNKIPSTYGIEGESRESSIHQSYMGAILYPITKLLPKSKSKDPSNM